MRRETIRQAWAERLAQQANSGLGIQSWCEREGIKASSFHYWRKRMKPPAPSKLIALPMPMEGEQSEAALELRTPHGYLIRLTRPQQVG